MSLFLTDVEIDAMCEGVRLNATKVRRLRAMGLVVNTKPNGRPLVVRSHAEAVMSGRAAAEQQPEPARPAAGNKAALIALFAGRTAA